MKYCYRISGTGLLTDNEEHFDLRGRVFTGNEHDCKKTSGRRGGGMCASFWTKIQQWTRQLVAQLRFPFALFICAWILHNNKWKKNNPLTLIFQGTLAFLQALNIKLREKKTQVSDICVGPL